MDNYSLSPAASAINERLSRVIGIYCGQYPINFDFENNQVIIPKGYILCNNNYYHSTSYPDPDTITITNTDDGISALWFDYSSKTYIVAHYSAFDDYASNLNLALVATFWYTKRMVFGAGPYYINGEFSENAYNYRDKMAVFCGTDQINFDFDNNQIIIPKGHIVYNLQYYHSSSYPDPDTITITNTDDGLSALVFDLSSQTYSVIPYSQFSSYLTSLDIVLIATFWYTSKTVFGASGPYLINGTYSYKTYGLYCGKGYINFDFTNSQIVIPSGYIIASGTYYSPSNSTTTHTITITNTDDGISGLFYDTINRVFIAAHYNDWVSAGISGNKNIVLLATYWFTKQLVYGASGPFQINGYFPSSNYDSSGCRFILPDTMYFLTGESLPVYKSSIVAANNKSVIDTFKTAVISQSSGQSPRYNYFYEDFDLNPDNLPTTFKIGAKQSYNPAKNYYSNITKVVTDPSTKTSSTPKILMIGDSLTNRSLPYLLKSKLASLGITATMIGTMANSGGEQGEGREGWEFQNFIGADNTHMDGTTITISSSGSTTTLYQNPFLKLAIPDDLIYRPTWCFRNTGANSELSYSTDTDKTGNFYIFDFANYLTTHSIATPDIVTIALSTNDITQEDIATSLADCRLGLSIMVRQIHAACPSAKIGIIPAPAWADTTTGNNYWTNETAPWIEHCITDLKSINISQASIVPVWCHMDRSWNWPYSATAPLTSINDEVSASRSEYIHFTDDGKYQYIDALSAYIVSTL